MTFQERLRERMALPDWPKIAFACKWRAGGCCQTCGKEFPHPYYGLHAHHNKYKRLGREWPGDLVALCAGCHATFTAVKRASAELELDGLRIHHAIGEVLGTLELARANTLDEAEDLLRRQIRDVESRLGDLSAEADIILLKSEIGRDGRVVRRAA